MRLAVIDMGTNTFNLLIVEYHAHNFKILYSTKHPVKLGQKLSENHVIDNSGIDRILSTLTMYLNEIKNYSVNEIIALATSSIRTAKNKSEILKVIKEKLNIHVQVIDGDREAELIYLGNQFAISNFLKNSNETYLVMDIGGGSTEFIIANQQNIFWKKSFLLGMARLMDEIKPDDPIRDEDIQRIHQYLDNLLQPIKEKILHYRPKTLIGSSGVFDSVAEMVEANLHSLNENKTESCCVVNIQDFEKLYQKILPLSYSERLKFKGLIEMRADMIVISFILIDYILKKIALEKLIVSFYSLKEGVMVEKLKK